MSATPTRAAIASVVAALLLGGLKGYAAWTTGSVAMLASLSDSLLDLIASLVTLAGVRIAAQPADANHRFGHGKAEALAALFQVVLISASAAFIAVRAIERLTSGDVAADPEAGIIVSVIAIGVTLALTAYQARAIAASGSIAIRTDRLHYQSDLFLNAGVIAALVLESVLHLRGADPVFGIGIALWLLWGAWHAASDAIGQLMDREWPEEKRRAFIACAASIPGFESLHDLRTRTSGSQDFAQFHIHVPATMSVAEAHDVVEALELRLESEFPGTEILIHVDPEGQVDRPGEPLREANELKG
ncbi:MULTISPECIES: cation diffusion facilitator family transporter [unclassified Sphingomonas]|uniref:cation diffusion facilitator family transporter n=1 Tax=unclassified Sphingomonas TaxID=196159 RepID=UPI002151246C|nr:MULTISPECIES: cation diffusion facilitator family transporter [unclassified Sphingomonas]MCR5870629.1 cation diffusion facilitator family transporter [Sphingomonas sp. J344]UUY01028.1 cation diffusion facilitator family transporter [Sphingomonas sp. J315]